MRPSFSLSSLSTTSDDEESVRSASRFVLSPDETEVQRRRERGREGERKHISWSVAHRLPLNAALSARATGSVCVYDVLCAVIAEAAAAVAAVAASAAGAHH